MLNFLSYNITLLLHNNKKGALSDIYMLCYSICHAVNVFIPHFTATLTLYT